MEECEDECFNHDGLLGDLNEDETINVLDIVLLVNIIINDIIPNNHIQWAADLNLDILLDVLDIVLLINVILDASEENRDSWEIISKMDFPKTL